MEFEAGKVYFSKRLQRPVLYCSDLFGTGNWVAVTKDGHAQFINDKIVDVDSVEGPMVRLCHYESAMEAAERVLALGLDIVTQRDL